jgi:hypothetical protein
MLKAFNTGGSCARVVLEAESNEEQKQSFERFESRLKDKNLVSLMASAVCDYLSGN